MKAKVQVENYKNPVVIDIPKLNSHLDLYITLNTECYFIL